MAYALVTEFLGRRQFFCGAVDVPVGIAPAFSPIIFNADLFDTEADALECRVQVFDGNDAVEVTEVADGGSSANLAPPRRKRAPARSR